MTKKQKANMTSVGVRSGLNSLMVVSFQRGNHPKAKNVRFTIRAAAKQIAFHQHSRAALQVGIDKLTDAAGLTLGPRGSLRSTNSPRATQKSLRVTTPTSEQLASLNLKEGKNVVTFTFSTAMLREQQVAFEFYLLKLLHVSQSSLAFKMGFSFLGWPWVMGSRISAWVTFVMSHVLAGVLPRQQFAIVQNELRRTVTQVMEKNREFSDKHRIRFLLSEGLERVKELDEILDMQGH
ncbi:hypothetical protein Droror1_Dr00010350 [Drosera rotundifolia]